MTSAQANALPNAALSDLAVGYFPLTALRLEYSNSDHHASVKHVKSKMLETKESGNNMKQVLFISLESWGASRRLVRLVK